MKGYIHCCGCLNCIAFTHPKNHAFFSTQKPFSFAGDSMYIIPKWASFPSAKNEDEFQDNPEIKRETVWKKVTEK